MSFGTHTRAIRDTIDAMPLEIENRSVPAADSALRTLARFFCWLTPGDEKALRVGFHLEPNPALEDIAASSDAPNVLMARVRDVLSHRFGGVKGSHRP